MLDAGQARLVKPNLLFLCHRLPYPPDKGDKIRAFRILEHFSRNYRIHLGCFVDDINDIPHIDSLRPLCATVKWFPLSSRSIKLKALGGLLTGSALSVASFANADMRAWVAEYLATHTPKVIFVYSSAMMQFVLGQDVGPARLVLDYVDVDSDKWRQYATTSKLPMRWLYAREACKLLAFDRRAAVQADAALFVSDAEASLFRTLSPETASATYAVANGIDCDFFSPAHAFKKPIAGLGPHLVFTGTMDYRPNIDAVTWFADTTFPRIQKVAKEATFTIVGSKPTRAVLALGLRPGITVTGRVADVRPYLSAADVVVAPLRIARGIQNKVLEGMAMGKPVVTTPQGLEGILAEPERHLLVAETPEGFADAVLRSTSPAVAHLGPNARHLMQTSYGWPACLAALDRLL